MSEGNWCYSFNGENYDGNFNTKKDATDEGLYYYDKDENESSLYVGQIRDISLGVNVYWLLDQLGEDAYEQAGEIADDFLCHVKNDHLNILEDKLNEVLHNWIEEFNYKPEFWTVDNVEKVK